MDDVAWEQVVGNLEEAKGFEICDQDNRQKFWHYVVGQHPFQVPPEEIDFDKPW
jgi:hypothetical protein